MSSLLEFRDALLETFPHLQGRLLQQDPSSSAGHQGKRQQVR